MRDELSNDQQSILIDRIRAVVTATGMSMVDQFGGSSGNLAVALLEAGMFGAVTMAVMDASGTDEEAIAAEIATVRGSLLLLFDKVVVQNAGFRASLRASKEKRH